MNRTMTFVGMLAAAVLAPALPVLADGCFVWRTQDRDLREPQQKAFIVHADGQEDLVLSVTYEGVAAEFGWLVPLPAMPEMSPAAGPVFATLSKGLQDPFVCGSAPWRGLTDSRAAGVQELEVTQHDVGDYDVALLSGAAGGPLERWLAEHGFAMPAGAQAVLDDYARRHWVIAAIRIDPARVATVAADLASGEIQPICFRFPTESPVFPLRISAVNGGPAEILLYVLAEQPLRPAPAAGMAWQVCVKPWQAVVDHIPAAHVVNLPAHLSHLASPPPPPDYLRDVYARFLDDVGTLWITQCRATVAPADMVDLGFVRHEAAAALSSQDVRERVEVAGYLGTVAAAASVPPLIDFLAGREIPPEDCEQVLAEPSAAIRTGQDLRSALWALGRSGDRRAVAELQRWAASGAPLYQIDALDALRSLDAGAAAAVGMTIVPHGGDIPPRAHCDRSLYLVARDAVIAGGGIELVPSLLHLASSKYETGWWRDPMGRLRHDRDVGLDALLMAAACGGATAQAEIGQWLVEQDAAWQQAVAAPDTLVSRGFANGFPAAVPALLEFIYGQHLKGHEPTTSPVFSALSPRPEVRDGILREVAGNAAVSPVGQCVMLAALSSPTAADREQVARIWSHARASHHRVWVDITAANPSSGRQVIAFDLDACAAAYAMGAFGATDTLFSWWSSVPWTEPQLKSEILVALARQERRSDTDPRLIEATVDYVRTVWNERARSFAVPPADGRLPAGVGPFWPYPQAFDAMHRKDAVSHVLRFRDEVILKSIVTDANLEPALRLFWLTESWVWLRHEDPERLTALLGELRGRLPSPELTAICDRISARVTQLAQEERQGPPSPLRTGR